MRELGGTLVCYNALKYDYCVEAAIESLCAACDEVVVIECYSEDGTFELVESLRKRHSHMNIIRHRFDADVGRFRLSKLTNIARLQLQSEWHLNLQADEVLHEKQFTTIRKAIRSGSGDSYSVRRLNFWGGQSLVFPLWYKNPPVSSVVTRLARTWVESHGDAESLKCERLSQRFQGAVDIFHYGFIRDRKIMCDKVIDMLSWFGFGVDARMVRQKKELGLFDPDEFHGIEKMEVYKGTHPVFVEQWLQERRNQWT